MKLQRPDPGIDAAKSGLHGKAGIFFNAGLLEKGEPRFDLQDLDPYLVFDSRESMLGTLEAETLDLDPATPSTLDVITATRAGVATFTEPDGTIATAPSDTVRVDYTQGEQLTPTVYQHVVQTDYSASPNVIAVRVTLSDISGPDGESGGVRVTETANNTQHYLAVKNKEIVSGTTYTVSFYVKEGAYSSVVFYTESSKMESNVSMNFSTGNATFGGPDLVSNSGSFTSVGDGWYRVVYSATAQSSGEMDLYVSPRDLSSYAGDVNNFTDYYGFQVEEGTTASDFVENTTGSPKFITGATYGPRVPMILVEPSATNLIPNSSSFENVNGSVKSTGFDAPDGSNDAQKISNINGATDPNVAWSSLASLSPSTEYSGSIFVKGNAGESIRFYLRRAFGGAMANSPFLNVVLTGSWQRVEIGSMTTASDNNNGRVFIFQASSGTPADEVYLWGAQIELGSVSTSVIPTSGSTVTRAADEISIDGTAFTDFFNTGGDGTFYLELVPTDILKTIRLLTGYGGSSSELILYTNNNSSQVQSWDGTNGENYGPAIDSQVNRIAFSYSSTAMKGSINGASEQSENHDGSFSGKTSIYLGRYTTVPIHYKRLIYWPTHSDSL